MQITVKEVERIAKLSRLNLTEEEKIAMQHELRDVLNDFEKLNKLDTGNVPPTAHILSVKNVLREDDVKDSMDRELLLENAPESAGGCFIVPRVVE